MNQVTLNAKCPLFYITGEMLYISLKPVISCGACAISEHQTPQTILVLCRDYPLIDPWSSAVIICRWNITKMISVGSKIKIVPAHNNGMLVA